MADTDSYTKPQRLNSETKSLTVPPNHLNPSKHFSNFLYKALLVAIFLVIIPLFPSQAPESINQTVSTRSWELLHLLFVGIAVSYGLFSRKSDETEKENGTSKFDNAQSYVSRLLQVSSVFDEESETTSGSDENKVQTWSNQYFRNEPVVVVAQENSVLDEQRGNNSSRIGEKPLFLPVRSLKSVEFNNGDGDISSSVSRSNSNLGSKRISRNGSKSRNGESKRLNTLDMEEKLEENGVLPSPIPWRSRSGRMEFKEEVDGGGSPPYPFAPSMEESEFNRLESRFFKSQSSKPSQANSTSTSPSSKKLSPAPTLLSSSELQAKNVEDSMRKKSFHKSSPPPPPPPPPPLPMSGKPPLVKPNSRSTNYGGMYLEKEFRRSSTSEPMYLGRNGDEDMLRRVNSATEARSRTQIDSTLMGKSVRTARAGDSFGMAKNAKEVFEDDNEAEAAQMEKTGKKSVRFNQTLVRADKPSRENVTIMPKTTFPDNQKEEKKDFLDEVIVETDDESESENDDDGGLDRNTDNGGGNSIAVSDGGPDVDKKADEFIAKFREQIRLQRIASIKRSSGQINRNSPR